MSGNFTGLSASLSKTTSPVVTSLATSGYYMRVNSANVRFSSGVGSFIPGYSYFTDYDSSGNLYTLFCANGGNGYNYYDYLVKSNSSGSILWAKRFTNYQGGVSLDLVNNSGLTLKIIGTKIYVVPNNAGAILELDLNGNLLRVINPPGSTITIGVTSAGKIISVYDSFVFTPGYDAGKSGYIPGYYIDTYYLQSFNISDGTFVAANTIGTGSTSGGAFYKGINSKSSSKIIGVMYLSSGPPAIIVAYPNTQNGAVYGGYWSSGLRLVSGEVNSTDTGIIILTNAGHIFRYNYPANTVTYYTSLRTSSTYEFYGMVLDSTETYAYVVAKAYSNSIYLIKVNLITQTIVWQNTITFSGTSISGSYAPTLINISRVSSGGILLQLNMPSAMSTYPKYDGIELKLREDGTGQGSFSFTSSNSDSITMSYQIPSGVGGSYTFYTNSNTNSEVNFANNLAGFGYTNNNGNKSGNFTVNSPGSAVYNSYTITDVTSNFRVSTQLVSI